MRLIHKITRVIVLFCFNMLLIRITLNSPIVEPPLDGLYSDCILSNQLYACIYLILYNLVVLANVIIEKNTRTFLFYGMIVLFFISYPLLDISLRRSFCDGTIIFCFWKCGIVLLFLEILFLIIMMMTRMLRKRRIGNILI